MNYFYIVLFEFYTHITVGDELLAGQSGMLGWWCRGEASTWVLQLSWCRRDDVGRIRVDYLLGDNPRATCYMVGYGNNYPRRVHQRGSSIVSIKVNPKFVSCRQEPATYNSALLGILARLAGGHGRYNQLLPVAVPACNPVIAKPKPASKPEFTPTPCMLFLFEFIYIASSSSPITIKQKMTNSWNDKGKTYYRYSTVVTNKSQKTLKDLKISISKLYGPIWGLTKSGTSFVFPKWLNALPAGRVSSLYTSILLLLLMSQFQATILPKNGRHCKDRRVKFHMVSGVVVLDLCSYTKCSQGRLF
ncbi:hypothetical protein F3Y22_tig00110348pilonHSYRG00355 [Hibiscus syriacus]|uniref:cellulase n=1 Tax=Hibiscus syriacus TaxID=106335 RepID=A0A6A3AZS2_HIBSY|nr:hypothetical protein F3Y22_tig00110348pilonHSYRG00355 [Hibiscus syriacus]